MDSIIAVEVRLRDGQRRYFLTWGRIQDPVDGGPISELVLRHCNRFDLGGEPVSARVAGDLREAMDTPWFFELFFAMCQERIPTGRRAYARWKRRVMREQEKGEFWYLWYDGARRGYSAASDEPDAVVEDGRVRRIERSA